MTGADDSQWVEVEGVVHSVAQSSHNATITLALRDGMIRAITPLEPGADYARLVDSTVVVHANAAPVWTKNGQMVGARLLFRLSLKCGSRSRPRPIPSHCQYVPSTACCASRRTSGSSIVFT